MSRTFIKLIAVAALGVSPVSTMAQIAPISPIAPIPPIAPIDAVRPIGPVSPVPQLDSAASRAPSAQDQLKAFVKNVTGATGSFRQSTTTTQGRAQTPQSGAFSFSRPGKFKWAVKTPYEQVIVSDGKQVYQYDPDLAQVTQRQVDQAIGTSPAAILFGSGSLDASFNVTSLPAKDGLAWLRAKPRNADAGFSQVDIGFTNNQPARIELLDTFGQTTRVELSGWVPNPALPASEFQFTAPPGVDIVKM